MTEEKVLRAAKVAKDEAQKSILPAGESASTTSE